MDWVSLSALLIDSTRSVRFQTDYKEIIRRVQRRGSNEITQSEASPYPALARTHMRSS